MNNMVNTSPVIYFDPDVVTREELLRALRDLPGVMYVDGKTGFSGFSQSKTPRTA